MFGNSVRKILEQAMAGKASGSATPQPLQSLRNQPLSQKTLSLVVRKGWRSSAWNGNNWRKKKSNFKETFENSTLIRRQTRLKTKFF